MANRKLLLLLAFLFLINQAYAEVFKVTISNPNNYDLIDYQVRIDLSNYLSQATYLKVFDANQNLLNFCYEQPNGECNTNPSLVIWVKVNISANSQTVIYVQTSDTNYATTGDNVFIFYDDFNDGVLNTSKWQILTTLASGSYSVSETNGQLVLSADVYNGALWLQSINKFDGKDWLEAKVDYIEDPITLRMGKTNTTTLKANGNQEWDYAMDTYYNGQSYYLRIVGDIPSAGFLVTQTQVTNWNDVIGIWKFRLDVNYQYANANGIELTGTDSRFPYQANGYYVYIGLAKYTVSATSGVLYTAKIDWIRIRKYADVEPSVTIEIVSLEINITNKRNKEFVSLVNVTVNVTNLYPYDVNTTIYYLLNNSLVYSKNISIPAKSSILDSYVFEILKEGVYNITVKVYDAELNQNVSDSFVFVLDLYDENVTYSNYTLYNNTKYVDTLVYQISVRCGALNHNITVLANFTDSNKTYTIVCDNETKIINDAFRFLSEGNKTIWFKLNAVNPSDSRYFGNESFIADLNPPEILYLNYTLVEGFRNNLTETAFYKVVDTISPIIYCNYTFNSISGSDTVNNATEILHNFNLTFDNNLKVVCKDLVNHTMSKEVLFSLKIHNLIYKDDITNSEGNIPGNFSITAYYNQKTYSVNNQQPKYFVVYNSENPVEYYLRIEDPNVNVYTISGVTSNVYLRYYYEPRQKANVTLYYTTHSRLYEIQINNDYSDDVIFSAVLNGYEVTEGQALAYGSVSLFLPDGLVYDICAKDLNELTTYCFERVYVTGLKVLRFISFPQMVYVDFITFTFEKITDNSYKVWLALIEPSEFTIKVYKENTLFETVNSYGLYWEKIYNLTEGIWRFILTLPDGTKKEFTIFVPRKLPKLSFLTDWELEFVAFFSALLMLGLVSLVGLGIGLISAGIIFILVGYLFQTTFNIVGIVGVAMLLIGIIYEIIKNFTKE